MADRTVAIRLLANVQGLVTGFHTATRAAEDFASRGLDRIARNQQHITTLSNSVGALGLAMTAMAVGAGKAAVDWETAWAGVLKTVDGTGEELAMVEEGLRDLARTLPATHTEIAGVAEAAGQLGIATGDVVSFTRTMIDLGETTNVTAQEAATSLARISNIMGTAAADVDRMGSTIVDLGNNSATTEREILELATRLAAAGRQAGLTEANVFAVASALSSVGVEAEAGGTAMSKVFTAVADAVRDGGDQLETFAEVAGVSSAAFRQAFEQDAAGAIGMFVEGMGRLASSGESTTRVFRDLGLTDQRLARSVLSVGSATGLWAEQMELANQAWSDNTALTIEAQKRYETAAARMQVAWNNIKDAAIEFGAVALPLIGNLASAVGSVAQWFGDLPEPIKAVTTLITGGGGLVLLGVAGLGKLLVAVSNVRVAMTTLGISAKTARVAVGGVGAALTLAAVALGAWIQDQAQAKQRAQEYVDTLDRQTGAITDNTRALAFQHLWEEGAIQAAERLGLATEDLIDASLGSANAMERLGISNAQAGGTFMDNLRLIFASTQGTKDLQTVANALGDEMVAVADAQAKAAAATEANVEISEQQAAQYETTTGTIEGQSDALAELISLQREAAGVVMSVMEAQAGFEQALDDASAAIQANGRTLDLSTQAGRDNQAALLDIADAGFELIESMEANGASQGELQEVMARTRAEFVGAARDAGASAAAADDLADSLGLIPEQVTSTIVVNSDEAELRMARFIAAYTNRDIPVNLVPRLKANALGGLLNYYGGREFDTGGYTGDGPINAPAGVVHGKEFVVNARATAVNRPLLEALNAGLPGYADGGYVQPRYVMSPSPQITVTAPAGMGGFSGPLVHIETMYGGTPGAVGDEVRWAQSLVSLGGA